ncbi:MAG: ribosome-associated translation inhibitor RaiA [Acidobacteriota bacterium]|nr:ribosome-associated translation inhibitor RaiA [Acidobacteriota bacterium]
MNIEISTRNFKANDRVREYATDKLSKVSKFVNEPVEARVTLEAEKHRKIADVHVAHRHGVLQATEQTDNMLDAINLAVDKIEKQARRSREKHKDKRRRADRRNGANSWPVSVVDRSSVGGTEGPKVVKSSELPIKPMSLEEAALELEGSKNEFIVFRDSASEQVSVLYRREDNNYGLIAPEF